MINIKDIERSIIKKYRKEIWRPVIRALQDYNMIEDNDRVAVAISGGKDSLILAKVLQELKRHSQVNFELYFLCMDPGFSTENRNNIISNCKELEIPVEIFNSNIFDVIGEKCGDQPCYLCARMRRGFLYEHAQKMGANKLALGHHFDDVVETIMLNVLYGGNFTAMMPKLNSTNFENMQIIRPLYYVEEKEIIHWKNHCAINAMDCGCSVARKEIEGKRLEVKELIKSLELVNPNVKKSIFKSSENVFLDAVLGFRTKGEIYKNV